ncbi:DUF222 domain-containing protein [Phycicoccus sp. HDW14]|uniref:DUF222 domain-containing protein n=1 Tax=Phycicoccus sp. HDW14 TaxID=2714941 RepID=UPI00140AD2E7|nr:DUF222 domain-containing protein [Phycicoccus sp. HDW14]QIM20240.1 DUF222 domain-containing protein [Phycicoccus sp. HDW14]
MDRGTISSRIAALREECARLGRELVDGGHGLAPEDAFALAGEAQGLANAADGLVAVASSVGARVELRLSGDGPVERVHPVGYVDQMAASMFCLEAGLTEGVAGRKVTLGAVLGERFPATRDLLVAGSVGTITAQKVVDACAGLDVEACARVDAELAPRLPVMDPARVMSEARRVATRVAADQVAAHMALRKRGRCVEVRPGEDGLTDWFASLPTATSAAMWSAVEKLAGEYRAVDDTLTVRESCADALTDLVLRNVTVSAQVTLGVPVVTDRPAPEPAAGERFRVEWDDDETIIDATTGAEVRYGDLDPASREALSWVTEPEFDPSDRAVVLAEVSPGFAVSGTHLPNLGWVEPATLANLLKLLPLDVARAVLEADTGTLASLTTGPTGPEGHRRLRQDEGRDLPDVGLLATRRRLRPRPRPSLAGRRHHPDLPALPLPTPPPLQATAALAPGPVPRRHHHLARPQRPHPHHRTPAPPRRLSTPAPHRSIRIRRIEDVCPKGGRRSSSPHIESRLPPFVRGAPEAFGQTGVRAPVSPAAGSAECPSLMSLCG